MKIAVAGLGIIGGSLCLALKRAGYSVDGWNRSQKALTYALDNGIIHNTVKDFKDYDTVFVALPPEATLNFINNTDFKDGATVADICGVKEYILNGINNKNRNFNFVGCHPMAGKEVSGVENACENLFDNASMVICSDEHTNTDSLEIIRKLTKEMGFGLIVECSAAVHDKKIAYTSQLAHIVSNAYVKDGEIDFCLGFTGGSFQDMTRIAGVDESVWASLYLKNSGNVSDKISSIIESLQEIKNAVDGGDKQKLQEILKSGRLAYENANSISDGKEIIVKKLK